jgi:MFS superfamily sulfate permease-like transporter
MRARGLLPEQTPGWRDVAAGAAVAGLLLPEAVAYSGIANLPPEAGIVGLLIGLLVYALCGTSRFAIVSATSSSAAVLVAATGPLTNGDVALGLQLKAGLVILAGALFLLGAAAKLGVVSAFISKPVLRGFTFGLGLVIILRQLMKLGGLNAPHGDTFELLAFMWRSSASWHLPSVAMGLGAWALMHLLSRWNPRWPAALLVLVGGGLLQHHLGLGAQGIATVGQIDWHGPHPDLPALDREQWLRLGELALALVLILYAESYGSIRSLALRHGDATAPNRDLFALGLANLLSGLWHGTAVGAGYSATAANEAAGALSRWAGLVAWCVVVMALWVVLPGHPNLPEPVLSAIVIHAVSHMLSVRQFRPYFTWHRDRLVALMAVFAVLWLGVLDGLLVAIGVSLFMTLRGLARARVVVLGRLGETHDFVDLAGSPAVAEVPGLLIVRPDAPLFFGNVEGLLQQVRAAWQQRPDASVLVLSLEESPDLDGTCVEALQELRVDVARRGAALLLARVKPHAQLVLQRAGVPDADMTPLSTDDAVAQARQRLPVTATAMRPT